MKPFYAYFDKLLSLRGLYCSIRRYYTAQPMILLPLLYLLVV
jgi:hypothetical protein